MIVLKNQTIYKGEIYLHLHHLNKHFHCLNKSYKIIIYPCPLFCLFCKLLKNEKTCCNVFLNRFSFSNIKALLSHSKCKSFWSIKRIHICSIFSYEWFFQLMILVILEFCVLNISGNINSTLQPLSGYIIFHSVDE